MKLNQAIEAGEALYTNLTAEGRENVRQEIRLLRQDWDELFEDVMAAQRQLEVSLVEWTSFSDSLQQLQEWLKGIESQLGGGDVPYVASLEEKKAQLQSYKVSQSLEL